ncbi:MAG: hypothetical protein WCX46_03820 [Candidatus Paceibacterota bacterium]
MKYFCGLDLSLTGTGIAVLNDNGKIIATDLIKSKKTGDTPLSELKRILDIRNRIFDSIYKLNIDTTDSDIIYFAIEGLAFLAKGTSLVQLSALNYFIREAIILDDCQFIIVAPTSLKRFATGKGNSEKDHIILEAYKKYGVDNIDNNIADAIFLANIASVMFGKEKPKNKMQEETINLLKKQI